MKFYIKQKVFSFKDKFTIMDEHQNDVFYVEGKMFSISNKLQLTRPDGTLVYHAKKKVFSFMPKYFIFTPQDEDIARVQRKFALKPKFEVEVNNMMLEVRGSLFAHSFQVYDQDKIVATIEKKIISWGDTYEIDILDEQRVELMLFIVIIIDQVIHEQENKGHNH